MRLIFHGVLREQFGDSVRMEVDTVAEALEGFSRQTPWPKDLPVHVVTDTERLESEESLKQFVSEVHIIPAMIGGGGKFTSIILGTVLVVAGIIIGPGSAIGLSLIVNGGLMILSGVMNIFMKAPTLKTAADPEQSRYLPINKNTTAANTPITMAWGRCQLSGHWQSLQSDSSNLSFGVFPTTTS